jgi:hypothetical protein
MTTTPSGLRTQAITHELRSRLSERVFGRQTRPDMKALLTTGQGEQFIQAQLDAI